MAADRALKGYDLPSTHTLDRLLRADSRRWAALKGAVANIPATADWQRVLTAQGYDLVGRDDGGFLVRYRGAPVAVAHPKGDSMDFGRLDAEGRPPEGVLLNDVGASGAGYGLLVSGSRLRLFDATPTHGPAAALFLELDATALKEDDRPFLGLLGPAYLAEGGLQQLQDEARTFSADLRRRLDDRMRQSVLPTLARALGRWATAQGQDLGEDVVREELRRGALTLVFRALFLLHAESVGHLPMHLSALVQEAADTATGLDPRSTLLWDGFVRLARAMRSGSEGVTVLEWMKLADPDFGQVLIGLGHDPETGTGVAYSTLDTGHLGHIYESLLSLQLSVADTALRYDSKIDRYVAAVEGEQPDAEAGDLLWLTHRGGRKRAGAYYTRAELVRHLVRQTVVPAFTRHLDVVRATAEHDPSGAARALFEFAVLDPACGSAHFLVQVASELADLVVSFLAQTPLPQVRDTLSSVAAAGASGGVAVEHVALLRRLVLERCVYGVDLSPMGAEIAKLSLWLAAFVPGLPLAYLDRNIQVGNSLIGIVDPEEAVAMTADARRLTGEHHAFHWPLTFPQVFHRPNPGFDAVVGNPPWEEVTVEAQSFYALYRPGIRRGLTEAERDVAVAQLIAERPDLPGKLAAEREHVAHQRTFLAAAEYPAMPGDPDLSKYFCQRYRALLRDGGALGVVLPRTTFVNQGSRDFRAWLFEQTACERIDFLVNRGRWAFDTHPQYTVALVAARKDTPAEDHHVRIAGTATSLSDWLAQVDSPGLLLAQRSFGHDRRPPLLRSQGEADILAKVRQGSPFPYGSGGRWRCFPVRELDETSDRGLWHHTEGGWPLWKGESFDQYDPHGSAARLCPGNDSVWKKVDKPRPGARSLLAAALPVAARREAVRREIGRARVAFNDVTQKDNSRTVIGCLVPPETFLTNKAPYLAFAVGNDEARAACLGVLNSLPFDWQARRFVEINLNFFILEGLSVPDLDAADYTAIAEAAARLSCVDARFADFATSVGVTPGPLDDGERERLRVEIDARVARAWGLTPDDLAVIAHDFTQNAVPAAYRERLTQRLIELG